MTESSNSTSSGGGERTDGGALATADRDAARSGGSDGRRVSTGGVSGGVTLGERSSGHGRSFFDIYKPGQGYYTRVCTSVGGGVLILGAGNFVATNLEVYRTEAMWTVCLQFGVPSLLVVGLGLLLYWIVGVNRTACDFFIATEGEMKKVSWSTRSEIIGSTKVVIWMVLLLGFLLFTADAVFIYLFRLIGVLGGES